MISGRKNDLRRTVRKIADYFTAATLIVLVIFAAAWFGRLGESEYAGPFKVTDGDSLESGGDRFRLEGIDAPEYRQDCRKDGASWPCGKQSARFLRSLIARDGAVCIGLGVDKYDRILTRCRAGSTDINAEMVAQGWAVSFGDYQGAEQRARAAGLGIWAGEFVRPGEWRDLHAGAAAEQGGEGLAEKFMARLRLWWQVVRN